MKLTSEQRHGVTIARVRGEVDSRTSGELQDQLLPLIRPGAHVLLEMSGVTFLSSAGLRTLLLLYRQITAVDGKVALAGLPPLIRDTMAVTGFLDFFADYPTVEEGLAALDY